MIDLQNKMIRQFDKEELILHWQVVFQTPFGWFEKLDDANTTCAAHDLNPQLCVIPTAMAVGATLYELR